MLDVLHYFLDEDMRYGSTEGLQIHDSVRTSLFTNLYGRPYKYSASGNKTTVSQQSYGDDEVKPFIPPTEMNDDGSLPFGDLLDAPIG